MSTSFADGFGNRDGHLMLEVQVLSVISTGIAAGSTTHSVAQTPKHMLNAPNPIHIPVASCDESQGHYNLHYTLSWSGGLKEARLVCSSGNEEIDLIAKASALTEEAKHRVKTVTKQLIVALQDLRDKVPRSREDLKAMVQNTRHPVTTAILSEFVLLTSEISAFGVFALITTMIGVLVLNPAAWIFVPAVLYVLFLYRDQLSNKNLQDLRMALQELDDELENGNISKDDYDTQRKDLIEEYFDAA